MGASTWAEVARQVGACWSQVGPGWAEVGALFWRKLTQSQPDIAAMSDRNSAFGPCYADLQNAQITPVREEPALGGLPGKHGRHPLAEAVPV